MNRTDCERLARWVEKQLDDSLDAGEFDQLQKMLTEHPEAREIYLDLMHQNAHLNLERLHLAAAGPGSLDSVDEMPETGLDPTRRVAWLPILAALAASLLLIVWWQALPADLPQNAPIVAKIIDASDAEWGDCTLATAIGSDLSSGRLEIKRGLTTIRFASGAEVTLESPAELEIQSTLRASLLAGIAVVEVPQAAHGFTLSTPTAVAIDHGTAFSVSIDRVSKTSAIEVLDGEVEVQHIGSDTSRRLKEKQRLVASTKGLSESDVSSNEAELLRSEFSGFQHVFEHRITTADGRGRDSSISRSQADEVLKNSRAELVLIKNPHDGFQGFSRKGYFAFDLGLISGEAVTAAKFVLTLQPSGLGFASKVGDCEFVVYGLTDESGDHWSQPQLSWTSAPANADGPAEIDTNLARELGRFVVQRGKQHGQVSIEGDKLVGFLNADTNAIVTLIVVRATKEDSPGGLVHGFANHSNSIAAPPALHIDSTGPARAN